MLYPSVLTRNRQFYALGNTPAVSLTRAVPQGLDADILSLGCGDVRNLLYTAYSESNFRECYPHETSDSCPVLQPEASLTLSSAQKGRYHLL